MRHLKYSLIFSLLLFSVSLNAQIFAGGSIGFSTSTGSTKTGNTTVDDPTYTSFSFSPRVGYFINSKMAVGAGLNFSTYKVVTPGATKVIDKTNTIGISPFVRYYAVSLNKFSVYAQGGLGFSLGSSKTKSGGTTTDGPRTTTISLGVFPGIAYDLNEKISFEASINLISLGYVFMSSKEEVGGVDVVDKSSSLNFGASTNNIVTSGNITVGAIFKF